MSPKANDYIGIDVASAWLEIAGAQPAQVKNEPGALRGWLQALKCAQPRAHLVCEATGRHHRALQLAAAEAAVPLSIVNPRQAAGSGAQPRPAGKNRCGGRTLAA